MSASLKLNTGSEAKGGFLGIGRVVTYSLHERVSSLIATSHGLLKTYEIMSSKITADGVALQLDWEANTDLQRLQALLDVGKAVAEDQITGLLFHENQGKLSRGPNSQRDGETWAKFAQAKALRKSHKSWAASARRTKKGIRRLVKHIPVA